MKRLYTVALGAIVLAIVAMGAYALMLGSPPTLDTSPVRVTSTASCSISGQPAGFLFRFMSTSNGTGFVPIVGAQVKATNRPAYCGSSPATKQTTITFTTNSTMWYSLTSDNNAGYTIVVNYSGQNYNITADLRPVSVTCASFFWPTGQTNVTITEFKTTC